jgi:hypothetical protein
MAGTGASIFVIAVGAILRYATNIHVGGIDLDTVGLILMVAGAVALVLSLIQFFILTDRTRRRGVVVDERREAPPVEERRDLPPRY